MTPRIFVTWIVLAGLLGIALGGSYYWSFVESRHPPSHRYEVKHPEGRGNSESRNEANETIAEYTFWLMLFTGILAVATVGLGVATVGLYRTGKEQIALAAGSLEATNNATELAKRNFVASHRPEVIIRSLTYVQVGRDFIGARLALVNRGATDAIAVEINGIIVSSGLPPDSGIELPHQSTFEKIANGAEEEHWLHSRVHFRKAELERSEAGLQLPGFEYRPVFCIGEIAYLDSNGARRKTGFCRQFGPSTTSWLAVENTEYEYAY